MDVTAIAPASAADLVALLLGIAPAHRHEQVLRRALATQAASLAAWEEQHLRYVEQGWGDAWQEQQTKQTALVTELTRVLAERFGC
jgi:hypothetical protein